VASVLDHVSVVVASALTTIGLAPIDTVGTAAAPTVTVTERLVEPPPPVQVTVNVLVAVSEPVLVEPDVPTAPAHDELHELAFELDQVSVELPPYDTEVGLAENETLGGGGPTVTVALALALPPAPVHVSV